MAARYPGGEENKALLLTPIHPPFRRALEICVPAFEGVQTGLQVRKGMSSARAPRVDCTTQADKNTRGTGMDKACARSASRVSPTSALFTQESKIVAERGVVQI